MFNSCVLLIESSGSRRTGRIHCWASFGEVREGSRRQIPLPRARLRLAFLADVRWIRNGVESRAEFFRRMSADKGPPAFGGEVSFRP